MSSLDSDICDLCGNTREWHRNPGASGVHRFAERPPSDEERVRAVFERWGYPEPWADLVASLVALLAQVRAEAVACEDCKEFRRQERQVTEAQIKRAEAAEAERDALREELARANKGFDRPMTTSCGHTWTLRSTACPKCLVALRERVRVLEEALREACRFVSWIRGRGVLAGHIHGWRTKVEGLLPAPRPGKEEL